MRKMFQFRAQMKRNFQPAIDPKKIHIVAINWANGRFALKRQLNIMEKWFKRANATNRCGLCGK